MYFERQNIIFGILSFLKIHKTFKVSDILSSNVESVSDITPCNKIDSCLHIWKLYGMTSFITCIKYDNTLTFFMPKM